MGHPSKVCFLFFFQAEDGIRDLVRSRGLGDVYKRQELGKAVRRDPFAQRIDDFALGEDRGHVGPVRVRICLLYTSDAADERSSVDLGGRRIIKHKSSSTSDESDQYDI